MGPAASESGPEVNAELDNAGRIGASSACELFHGKKTQQGTNEMTATDISLTRYVQIGRLWR